MALRAEGHTWAEVAQTMGLGVERVRGSINSLNRDKEKQRASRAKWEAQQRALGGRVRAKRPKTPEQKAKHAENVRRYRERNGQALGKRVVHVRIPAERVAELARRGLTLREAAFVIGTNIPAMALRAKRLGLAFAPPAGAAGASERSRAKGAAGAGASAGARASAPRVRVADPPKPAPAPAPPPPRPAWSNSSFRRPPIPLPPPPPRGRAIEADSDGCRFVIGEPRELKFCARPLASRRGPPYCAECRVKLGYDPGA